MTRESPNKQTTSLKYSLENLDASEVSTHV